MLLAKDETIQMINVAINNLEANASGLNLSAKIFETIAKKENKPYTKNGNEIVKEFQMSMR